MACAYLAHKGAGKHCALVVGVRMIVNTGVGNIAGLAYLHSLQAQWL